MNKLSVLIDLDRLKDLNNGLGQVALLFGKALAGIKDKQLSFTFLVPKNYVGFFGNSVQYEVVSLKRRYFPALCKKYDLWYTIHQDSCYFPSRRNTPYIICINDLNFLGEKTKAKAQKRINRLQRKVDRAAAITTISKYTETVVRENLSINNTPLQVIYTGVEVKTFEKVKRPAYVPEGSILFSIGVVQAKKNYGVLLEFMLRLPDYCLIIAGNKNNSPFAIELQQRINELGLQHRVILPGMIADEDKYWLYKYCKAVLFPSKFEGFGFPPIEAMQFGKPVFASTFSSIPEVCEDKAYYWENFDPDYMSTFFLDKMETFKNDKDRAETLRNYSKKYVWEENVALNVQLFKKILNCNT